MTAGTAVIAFTVVLLFVALLAAFAIRNGLAAITAPLI